MLSSVRSLTTLNHGRKIVLNCAVVNFCPDRPRQCTAAVLQQRQYAKKSSRWSLFGRGGQKDIYEENEESEEMELYQKQVEEMEKASRLDYLEGRRNKSRLSASDRQILQGLPPNEGVLYEYNNMHRSRKFKREMLGRFGSRTGIDPGISWATHRDIELAKEWEELYQPVPLPQMIADSQAAVAKVKEDRLAREKVIADNLAKMETTMKQWRARVASRNKQAEAEKHRREMILGELKQEFGYDINPDDAYMQGRIVEREKVLVKQEREAKKALKKEKKAEKSENS